ncbi:MAG: glycosyltransferase family 4 protein [Vicinamibacterales bacterium]
MTTTTGGQLLIVGNMASGRGARAASQDLAEELRSRGWAVRQTSSRRPRLARLGDMLATTWRCRKSCDVALVDLYSGLASLWALGVCLLWRAAARKPYIVTLHGGNLPRFSASWSWLVRRVLEPAAAVTSPSRYLQVQMAAYRPDLKFIPNGVAAAAPRGPRLPLRPALIWVRSFHAIYNPVLAVRVLARVKAVVPDATLTMVGPDKGDGSLERVRQEAARLDVADALDLVGPVAKAEVADWLGRAAIFINTTNVDNTPVSVIEAMACGLAVVSTDVGGLPYLLDDGVDALLVPPDDPAAMAAAIQRLLHDPALAARLTDSAVRKAGTFDWSLVVPQWLELLSTTVGPGSGGTP